MTEREKADEYIRLILTGKFAEAAGRVYPGDVDKFKNMVLWCAEAMAPMGEDTSFLELFGEDVELDDLRVLSPVQFLGRFFEGMLGTGSAKIPEEIYNTTQITAIEPVGENTVRVEYRFKMRMDTESIDVSRDFRMQEIGGEWYILLDEGFTRSHVRTRERVQDFKEREAKDRPIDSAEGELEPFALWGYRDDEGNTIIEPRYREAGAFAEGLAPVQFFNKYGYLGTDGNTAIDPRFDRAEEFSDGRAAVAVRNDDFRLQWGYIDTDGNLKIPYKYDEAMPFSEGLAAVAILNEEYESYWGYIDENGRRVLGHRYLEAGPFENGEAEVMLLDEGDELIPARIDRQGRVLGAPEE